MGYTTAYAAIQTARPFRVPVAAELTPDEGLSPPSESRLGDDKAGGAEVLPRTSLAVPVPDPQGRIHLAVLVQAEVAHAMEKSLSAHTAEMRQAVNVAAALLEAKMGQVAEAAVAKSANDTRNKRLRGALSFTRWAGGLCLTGATGVALPMWSGYSQTPLPPAHYLPGLVLAGGLAIGGIAFLVAFVVFRFGLDSP